MAQTSTKRSGSTRSRSGSRRSPSSNGSRARSNDRSTSNRSTSSRSSSSSRRRSSSSSTRSQRNENPIAKAVSKAKVPLAAGGAAVAGLAGGIALTRDGRRRKVLGVSIPGTRRSGDTAKALGTVAKELAKTGQRVGQLTAEVRHVREEVNRD
jgi:hypothetical protein